MNRSRLLLLTSIAVACLATWVSRGSTFAQEKRITGSTAQWDYKIMSSDDLARLGAPNGFKPQSGYANEVEEKGLNKLGAENWELVGVTTYGPYSFRYFFKRSKAEK